MFSSTDKPWRAVTASVRGVSHDRTGAPNQDAVRVFPERGEGPPIVLAVSDGHGSAKCIRSDVGSRLAADVAIDVLNELLQVHSRAGAQFDPSTLKRVAEEQVPEILESRWKAKVAAHFQEHPWTEEELSKVETTDSLASRQKIEQHFVTAYGCTLLAVLIEQSFIVCLQIGDGDMISISERAEVAKPIPRDPRHFANETTSLSSDQSWKSIQVRFQQIVGSPPAFLLLCSDGYSNAFRNELDLLDVGREFVEALREDGVEAVAAYLPDLLSDASRRGSGDDVTVGMLFRTDAATALWPDWRPPAEEEAHQNVADQPAADDPPPMTEIRADEG